MTRVLAAILEAKHAEIAALRTARRPAPAARTQSRADALAKLGRASGEPLRLLTEVKRRSPTAGPLSTTLAVPDRAVLYARGGAAMISVLCDVRFFDGGFTHLEEARRALDAASLPTPLLAKEFILDEVQLEEAASRGADAALLIARIVDRARLATLVKSARALALEPLVEVVTEDELEAALEADAKVIGVNARDLDTLAMDPERAARVLSAIPRDRIALHLSGLKGPDDIAAVAKTRADGALIGEALMRLDDPSALLRAMREAAG